MVERIPQGDAGKGRASPHRRRARAQVAAPRVLASLTIAPCLTRRLHITQVYHIDINNSFTHRYGVRPSIKHCRLFGKVQMAQQISKIFPDCSYMERRYFHLRKNCEPRVAHFAPRMITVASVVHPRRCGHGVAPSTPVWPTAMAMTSYSRTAPNSGPEHAATRGKNVYVIAWTTEDGGGRYRFEQKKRSWWSANG